MEAYAGLRDGWHGPLVDGAWVFKDHFRRKVPQARHKLATAAYPSVSVFYQDEPGGEWFKWLDHLQREFLPGQLDKMVFPWS